MAFGFKGGKQSGQEITRQEKFIPTSTGDLGHPYQVLAVIFCQFQYRVAVGSGLTGSKQVVEIFAYGTAVTFLD